MGENSEDVTTNSSCQWSIKGNILSETIIAQTGELTLGECENGNIIICAKYDGVKREIQLFTK